MACPRRNRRAAFAGPCSPCRRTPRGGIAARDPSQLSVAAAAAPVRQTPCGDVLQHKLGRRALSEGHGRGGRRLFPAKDRLGIRPALIHAMPTLPRALLPNNAPIIFCPLSLELAAAGVPNEVLRDGLGWVRLGPRGRPIRFCSVRVCPWLRSEGHTLAGAAAGLGCAPGGASRQSLTHGSPINLLPAICGCSFMAALRSDHPAPQSRRSLLSIAWMVGGLQINKA